MKRLGLQVSQAQGGVSEARTMQRRARWSFWLSLLEQVVAKGVRTSKRRFTFTARIAEAPMSAAEWQATERLLARLIARAYAHDHPELFRDRLVTGPLPTAAAEVATPTTSGSGPVDSEIGDDGHDEDQQRGRSSGT